MMGILMVRYAHGIARWFTEEHNDAIVFTINMIFVCLLLNMIYSGLFDRNNTC